MKRLLERQNTGGKRDRRIWLLGEDVLEMDGEVRWKGLFEVLEDVLGHFSFGCDSYDSIIPSLGSGIFISNENK